MKLDIKKYHVVQTFLKLFQFALISQNKSVKNLIIVNK